MEGLEKGKIIVFKGNVIAKQVDLYLFSDMLTAYVNEETNEIERAKAEGNVKIVKLDRTATCKEALFYNDKGEIVLKGDVIVFSGNDKVSGDVVTYYINEDRVHVQGRERQEGKGAHNRRNRPSRAFFARFRPIPDLSLLQPPIYGGRYAGAPG